MEWNRKVPGLKEAAAIAVHDWNWTPVITLLEVTIPKDSVEYKQLQQMPVERNILEACSRRFKELWSIFLNSGVKKASCTMDEVTDRRLLYCAAMNGYLSLVKLLLNVGADIDCKVLNGETPLVCAVQGGSLEVVRHLISAGADINTYKCGKTLLDASLRYNTATEKMLQLLLDSGCDSYKSYLYCPLYWTVRSNNIKCVKMLLDAGANVNGTDTYIPLHITARCGFISIMQVLLDYGADINIKNSDGGSTALHQAVEKNLQSVKFLIEHGSLINSVNNNQDTPLELSIFLRQFDITMLLINSGADLNLPIYNTVLPTAVRVSAPIHVIEYLLEHGADVTAVYYNETALQLVIFNSKYSSDETLQLAKLLLLYGSNHYVQNYYGNTVLHWACRMGDVELVEYLIHYGLNVDAKNREGKNPSDIAREKGHNDIVKAIIHYHCKKYTNF